MMIKKIPAGQPLAKNAIRNSTGNSTSQSCYPYCLFRKVGNRKKNQDENKASEVKKQKDETQSSTASK